MDKWVVILKEEDEELDLLNEAPEKIPDKKVLETVLKYVIVFVKIYFTL